MTVNLDEIKAALVEKLCVISATGISQTAKLLAICDALGATAEQTHEICGGRSPATYRRAKAALKNERSKMSDSAQKCAPALKNEQDERSKMSAPLKNERECSKMSASRARGVEPNPTVVEVVDTNTPTTIPLSPSLEVPPSPPSAFPAAKVCKRGARLPADWKLPVDWQQWARVNFPATSEAAVALEADKFRDFWCSKTGQGATKLDWQATWRNWCRTAFAAKPGRQPINHGRSAYDERMARQRAQIAEARVLIAAREARDAARH